MWAELAENLLCLEEKNWENLVDNGTKEQRLDFLKHKEKYSILAALDKYEQMKKELKSAHWYQTVQNEDIAKLRQLLQDCKQLFIAERSFMVKCTRLDDLNNIITKIDEVLGNV